MRRGALLLVGTLLGIQACTPDFDEVWQVKDLRILALRADPPEVLEATIDATGRLALPETIPPVTVTALVVDPTVSETAPVEWELWLCSAEDVRCDEAEVQQLYVPRHSSPMDRITTDVTVPRELLPALLQADPLKGFGGLPVMVELRVWRGPFAARGVKRLVYGAPLPPEKEPNKNPSITDVTVEESQQEESAWNLLPQSDPADKERYWVATFVGGKDQYDEYLTYAFYTTAGRLSYGTTGGKPSPFVENKKIEEVSSDWIPADPAEPTDLWIVLRDDRGGVDWIKLRSADGQAAPTMVSFDESTLASP